MTADEKLADAARLLLGSGMVRLVGLGFVVALGCAVGLGCAMADPAPARPREVSTARPAERTKGAKKKKKAKRARRTSIGAHTTNPSDADDTPAVRYAQLGQDACEAELAKRDIAFERETGDAVLAPVRLMGPLHGVVFRTDGSEDARATSRYEIADCRLVLALDDFAEILDRHDIVEVRHYSMYRPPRAWPEGKIGKQHAGALALDAGRFIDIDGKVLDVDHDFHGAIGAKTCGDGAGPRPSTPAGLELRAILCEAVERRMFNVVLTPNYNRPHHNHFHLEVMAGVRWFLVH